MAWRKPMKRYILKKDISLPTYSVSKGDIFVEDKDVIIHERAPIAYYKGLIKIEEWFEEVEGPDMAFHDLMQEVRGWIKEWDAYDRKLTHVKPPTVDDFIERMKSYGYTVTCKESK